MTEPQPSTTPGFGIQPLSHGIDYAIRGHEMQFIEIELDTGESVISEAGALMFKSASVQMETIFGDGSQKNSGFFGSLLGAGKRWLTGESLFNTMFTQRAPGKGRVAFSGPYPGTIMALKLSDYKGKLICQKDSFLCAAKGVAIGIHFQKRILTGLFGGGGFIMEKLEGDGLVFIHVGGTLRKIDLQPGETLHVDTGCLVAFTSNVTFDVEMVRGIKSMLFGGEGLFLARLQGPGTVWMQSLPFARLAGRIYDALPRRRQEAPVSNSYVGGN